MSQAELIVSVTGVPPQITLTVRLPGAAPQVIPCPSVDALKVILRRLEALGIRPARQAGGAPPWFVKRKRRGAGRGRR